MAISPTRFPLQPLILSSTPYPGDREKTYYDKLKELLESNNNSYFPKFLRGEHHQHDLHHLRYSSLPSSPSSRPPRHGSPAPSSVGPPPSLPPPPPERTVLAPIFESKEQEQFL